ncbi:opsin 9 isoform X2 [Mugil cephalus]|uniref:opsin 9 isoform X2 n=1 Tax=Mugil cephalus TaxID=48193 RepID=UPI001FB6926C|nr:opsin 9 isoform X2 [Mugil cephalus]
MGKNGSYRSSWFVPSSIEPSFVSQLSTSVDVLVAVFLIFTGVSSVLGNGTVLLVYWRKRQKLRPPELLTINLALCDFGFSLLGAPFFIISSLCHAWVFGEMGCFWYGIQGFVFGIGSLLTTCLISLERCLKICCLRYGRWLERRHVYLAIAAVWLYTLFWSFLPAFGFGSYGPEPYGTSCTINWWRMRSSANDRIYIFLILTLCFGFPTLAIITSYLAILMTMAAVVCASFLLAWMPYAAVSLISALFPKGAESPLQTAVQESIGMASSSPAALKILDAPSLLNWTASEYFRQFYYSPEEKVDNAAETNPSLSKATLRPTPSPHSYPSIPHVVTLIPVLFAKSHCMLNPIIYQIMNRDFRDEVYLMLFGREKAERRRLQSRVKDLPERSMSLSYYQNWRGRSSPLPLSAERDDKEKTSGGRGSNVSWTGHASAGTGVVDFVSEDTRDNMERHCSIDGQKTRGHLRGSSTPSAR